MSACSSIAEASLEKAPGDISLGSLFPTRSLLKCLGDCPISWQTFFTKLDPEMVLGWHESCEHRRELTLRRPFANILRIHRRGNDDFCTQRAAALDPQDSLGEGKVARTRSIVSSPPSRSWRFLAVPPAGGCEGPCPSDRDSSARVEGLPKQTTLFSAYPARLGPD